MNKIKKLWLVPLCLAVALFTGCKDDNNPTGNASWTSTETNDITITLNKSGINFLMIKVAPGTLTLGATPEQTEACSNEKPAHNVTFTQDYYMGETEVTQAIWQAVMGYNPSVVKNPNAPVENVSWNECQVFINKLNSMTTIPNYQFSLPSEAEWEFAARGGILSTFNLFSGSNEIGNVAYWYGNSESSVQIGKQLAPNELNLYDMSGNVAEWCQDMYADYTADALTDPLANTNSSLAVIRGGSWISTSKGDCRVARRIATLPNFKNYSTGLRICLHHTPKISNEAVEGSENAGNNEGNENNGSTATE